MVLDRCDRHFTRHADRWILAGDVESALAGVWIGTIQHPAMLLTFADGMSLEEDRESRNTYSASAVT